MKKVQAPYPKRSRELRLELEGILHYGRVNTGAMLLRLAIFGDEMAVARVHGRSWQAGYRGFLPNGYVDGLRPEARAA